MMKAHFITPLKKFACIPFVKKGEWDGETWITISNLFVRMPDNSIECIESGFVTNFGSIPRPMRITLDRMGKSLRAYVFHDMFYSKGFKKYKQRECDKFLYDLSRDDGESWWSAQKINKGLAIGGWANFRKTPAKFRPIDKETLQYITKSNGFKLC
jgi:hypothetical protein